MSVSEGERAIWRAFGWDHGKLRPVCLKWGLTVLVLGLPLFLWRHPHALQTNTHIRSRTCSWQGQQEEAWSWHPSCLRFKNAGSPWQRWSQFHLSACSYQCFTHKRWSNFSAPVSFSSLVYYTSSDNRYSLMIRTGRKFTHTAPFKTKLQSTCKALTQLN